MNEGVEHSRDISDEINKDQFCAPQGDVISRDYTCRRVLRYIKVVEKVNTWNDISFVVFTQDTSVIQVCSRVLMWDK